jgi:two-component system chemotaxis response regulator CheB
VYGKRVIGVILSGNLDDGASGLWTIKRLGGLAVIQDIDEADFPDMPRNVAEFVEIDHSAKIAEKGPLLARLCQQTVTDDPVASEEDRARVALEISIAQDDDAFEKGIMKWGELTPFTCPECHGVLVKLQEDKLTRFRCHTGHAFTPSTLLAGVTAVISETMWQAMRGLEEAVMLLRKMGADLESQGQSNVASLFYEKADAAAKQARIVHDSLPHHEQLSRDIRWERGS